MAATVAPIAVTPLPPPTPAVEIPQPKPLIIGFASGSARLSQSAKRELDEALSVARRSRSILIRGRTDELGSVAVNEQLAFHRALAVRDYLNGKGLPETTSIRISARGSCCYVRDNATAEGRALNRRVEIDLQPADNLAEAHP